MKDSQESLMLKYFSDMKLTDAQMKKVLRMMTYQFCHKGEKVFDFGDEGDQFYMIIQGGVEVLIPQGQPKAEEPQ